MTNKFFRPTVLNIKNFRKAPAFKNTAPASHAARVDKFQDHFDANNLEGRMSKFDLTRGHSVLKELGKNVNANSILAETRGSKASSIDSIFERFSFSKSKYSEQSLRSSIAGGKGMASQERNPDCPKYFRNKDSEISDFPSFDHSQLYDTTPSPSEEEDPISGGMTDPDYPMTIDPEDPSERPGVDDNGGGGNLDARSLQKLSQGLNKDPIINPKGEDLGGGYLSDSQLKQMESELRNAKDPATNWGEEHYDNFVGTVVMDRMEVSLKAPATNWGNDYTSTVEVIETMITAPDVF